MDIIIDFDMQMNDLLIKLYQLRATRRELTDDCTFSSDVRDVLLENLTKEIEGIERDVILITEVNMHEV